MRRTVFLTAAVALGGLLAFRVYQESGAGTDGSKGGGSGGPGSRAQVVEAATPESSRITEQVSLVGSLRAAQRVEVTPKLSGRVVEIRVDRGDWVGAGQVIARLEDDELRQQVRRAEAALQVAEASVAQREAELAGRQLELDRLQNLARDGVVSSQQLQQAETNLQVSNAQKALARAQVAQAEAELEELRIRLGQTEIVSPLTGSVAQRYIDVGALVSSSTPLVLILDLSTVKTVVNVPEREINKIAVGNQARVVVDALAGREFQGRVLRISPLLDAQTRTAPVEIELDNRDGLLKAEMFARVDLNLEADRDALMIPRDSLVYRSNRPGVFVIDGESVRFQAVVTGVAEGDRIEVVSGLSVGETIVARGANLLKTGDSVRVMHPEGD
ncbi:MAG TPA: efflux RND transporter periplasmic adaptor subunit [Vicinamibacteria bacterium]|nr:efflux RND transporter periplasmic adaptor subunit [Vicinamibacteria bacterium]